MRLRRAASRIAAPLAALVAIGVLVGGAAGAPPAVPAPVPGSAGTDTALPATDSKVQVRGRGAFSSLEITVNQTADLTNQAISITWSGGTPTVQGPGRFAAHYLQFMQCWGDDDGAVPANPGPPPEQCQTGAASGLYEIPTSAPLPNGLVPSRIISARSWGDRFSLTGGVLDPVQGGVWRPFKAVNGTTVGVHIDPNFNPSVQGGNYWLNPFFNVITTNEIAAASTGPNGTGSELFEVQTGLQASGLGCGQRVQPVAGGQPKVPKCWLVIVPRGAPTAENAGTPFEDFADQNGVATSPLGPAVWPNRIAIPLDFKPIESPCALGVDERRVSGSDLATGAIASWQPALCAGASLPPFSFAPVSDAQARQQIGSNQPGGPSVVVVGEPLSAESSTPESPVVYAPLSVSGVTIGFNIERNPKFDAPPAMQALAGVRVAELNLTPRLVAKLLTQSYTSQVLIGDGRPTYPWITTNPVHLAVDPDFLRFNPEFQLLQIQDSRTFGGLQLPAGASDAASQVWAWILADPEAAAWLAGAPDQWGMKVNPVYSTNAATNSTGLAFASPLPNSYPKADPYCFQKPPRGTPSVTPPPLCGTDWMPYNRGYADGARIARIAFDGARIAENPTAQSASDVWKRDLPQFVGRRAMMALVDSPSATLYGLQAARLSRAGDNGDTRSFIAPDSNGLTAGVAAMKPGASPGVFLPDPSVAAPGAYPLTTLTTAIVRPLSLDTQARSDVAAFLDYVAGPGQVVGPDLGQLPAGYLPLPSAMKARTVQAAVEVRTVTAPAPTTTTVPSTSVPSAASTTIVASSPGTVFRPTTSGTRPVNTSAVVPTTPTETTIDPASTTTTVEQTTSTAATSTTAVTVVETVAPTTTAAPTTPAVAPSPARFAMAGVGVVALVSTWVAFEITKRTRRSSSLLVDASAEVPHG